MARFLEISAEDAAEGYDAYMKYLTPDGTSTLGRARAHSDRTSALHSPSKGIESQTASVADMFRLDSARRANAELDREGWQPRGQ